jgi:hypothetical protein
MLDKSYHVYNGANGKPSKILPPVSLGSCYGSYPQELRFCMVLDSRGKTACSWEQEGQHR